MNPVRTKQTVASKPRITRVSNGVKTFSEKVKDIVRKIPKGKTMTYKQVATRAGNENASRAVGAIMRQNYATDIPCHRVIGSDGKMRGYNRGGVDAKTALLRKEKAIT